EATAADILVFLDGDYADDPTQLDQILGPLLRGEADLVIGTRNGPGSDPDALPPHQRAGNRVCALLLRSLYRVPLDDVGSFRAIRADTLRSLHMQQMTYGWPVEMVVKAARKGYRIQGVPVRYRRRIGESKVGGTMRGSLAAGYRMLLVILRGALSRTDHLDTTAARAKGRP
ncbi:MAG: glycosyltransferase, partial [Chloroflexota bacterium]|nr:glycosyltransferase [Chloroflexota bacterium]